MIFEEPKEFKPHAYQRKAAEFLVKRDAALLFLDPGLGKTATTLLAIRRLFKRGEASRVLVVAPLRVCQTVWAEEARKWLDFYDLKISVVHGAKKLQAMQREADIYVTNFESLPWILGAQRSGFGKKAVDMKRWGGMGFDTLVVDEISKLKHTDSERFKLLKQVLHTFKRRWGLTGSPATNGLEGVFGQAYSVDMGKAFGPYITRFRQEYFVPIYPGSFDLKLREGAEERIYAVLSTLALRMSAEDYLKLPGVVPHVIRVDMPPDARRVYDELEADLITRIDSDIVTAATAAVALGKCRQVATGAVYTDLQVLRLAKPAASDREWIALHDAKVSALAELIDELQGQQVLVTYEFKHTLDALRKRFGEDISVIGGGVVEREVRMILARWNAGELPLLFGHPASMGHGLNLQASGCRHICHITPTWDFELYDQVNRRILRQGNDAQRIFIHSIVARGTVDEAVLGMLASKDRNQRALFDAIKAHRAEREERI